MIYSADISIKSPSFIRWNNDGTINDVLYFTYNKSCKELDLWKNIFIDEKLNKYDKWDRFNFMYNFIDEFIYDCDLFIVEGSSMNSSGKIIDLANNIGFIIGNIKNKFDCKIIELSPKEIKKKFTTKGNADKPRMRRIIKENYKDFDDKLHYIEDKGKVNRYDTPLEDIVDAFAIGKLHFNGLI